MYGDFKRDSYSECSIVVIIGFGNFPTKNVAMKIAVGEEEELIRSLWISLLGIVFKPREYKSILLLLVQYRA